MKAFLAGCHARSAGGKMGSVMDTPLHRHLIALGFAFFWIVFMVLWSGEYSVVNIVILTVCGLLAGYFWVWAMVRIMGRLQVRNK
jgi:hypothetical protein